MKSNNIFWMVMAGVMMVAGCKKEEEAKITFYYCKSNSSASVTINGKTQKLTGTGDCTAPTADSKSSTSVYVVSLPKGDYDYKCVFDLTDVRCYTLSADESFQAVKLGTGNITTCTSTSGTTGGSSPNSLNGTWQQTNNGNGCSGTKVYFDGSTGRVTSAPSACCFKTNNTRWKNYSTSSRLIDIMIVNQSTCGFLRYDRYEVVFKDSKNITIGSNTFKKI